MQGIPEKVHLLTAKDVPQGVNYFQANNFFQKMLQKEKHKSSQTYHSFKSSLKERKYYEKVKYANKLNVRLVLEQPDTTKAQRHEKVQRKKQSE